MKTVSKPVDVHWLPVINFGGRPRYGGVDIFVYPITEEKTEIILQTEDDGNWYADIREGLNEFLQKNHVGHVRIVVTHIFWHTADTNAKHMKFVGYHAIEDALVKHGVEL